jgi:CBS domain-containing protein
MSFAIIDQGRRVKTPLRTLFPDKGVDRTSASDLTHSGTHDDKNFETKNKEFRNLLENTAHTQEQKTTATYEDLKPSARPIPKKQGLLAEQVMSSPVHSIAQGTTVHSAWERMQALNISHLMVVDTQGKPVGMLSTKDIAALGQDSTQSITDYYNQKLIAGYPNTEVTRIAACFLEYDINAIPIFDDSEQLVGIVCRADLLRLIISGAHIEGWA